MSDLLIRGMEMPEYGVPVYIEPNGTVWVYPEHGKSKYHAISVHPHGRLIDVDALDKLVGEPFAKFLSRLDLKCPPAVIPASE